MGADQRGELMGEGFGPHYVVCQECGRSTQYRSGSTTLQWWLVATRDDGGLVVACPQHITEWRLRVSGMGRKKHTREWAALAKSQDKPPAKPFAEPFPLGGDGPPTDEQVRAVNELAAETQRMERDYGIRFKA